MFGTSAHTGRPQGTATAPRQVLLESELQAISLDGPVLGSSPNAVVRALPESPGVVAKVFHRPPAELAERLAAMIANPPLDPQTGRTHAGIAWPVERLLAVGSFQDCVGYLMPHAQRAQPLTRFFDPAAEPGPRPHFGQQVRAARQLAAAVRALHARGHAVGSWDPAHVLLDGDGRLTLVSADSFQVRNGLLVFPGRGPAAAAAQGPEQDAFFLAVAVSWLLTPGLRAAVPVSFDQFAPPAEAGAPPLPAPVEALLKLCAAQGRNNPGSRPDADAWERVLGAVESQLLTCPASDRHSYHGGLPACPWCVLAQAAGRDPYVAAAPPPPAPPSAGTVLPVARVTGAPVRTATSLGTPSSAGTRIKGVTGMASDQDFFTLTVDDSIYPTTPAEQAPLFQQAPPVQQVPPAPPVVYPEPLPPEPAPALPAPAAVAAPPVVVGVPLLSPAAQPASGALHCWRCGCPFPPGLLQPATGALHCQQCGCPIPSGLLPPAPGVPVTARPRRTAVWVLVVLLLLAGNGVFLASQMGLISWSATSASSGKKVDPNKLVVADDAKKGGGAAKKEDEAPARKDLDPGPDKIGANQGPGKKDGVPPGGKEPPPGPAKKDPPPKREPPRPFEETRAVLTSIQNHLLKTRMEDRVFMRYFTLEPLHNDPRVSAKELEQYRTALVALLHYLQPAREAARVEPVNAARTVFVIDLRAFGWERPATWRDLLRAYPYGLLYNGAGTPEVANAGEEVTDLSGSDVPLVRVDWFLAEAVRPQLRERLGPDAAGEPPAVVTALAGRYRQALTAADAARELSLRDVRKLQDRIRSTPRLAQSGLAAFLDGGTVAREDWGSLSGSASLFQEAALELNLGTPYRVR